MNNLVKSRFEELQEKFLKSTDYVDLNMFGPYEDENFNTIEIALRREKAIMNSVRMWVLSRQGDYYREPERGGIIELLLGSPMNDQQAETIVREISNGFAENFDLIELQSIDVFYDYDLKLWFLAFKVIDLLNKRVVDFNINAQV